MSTKSINIIEQKSIIRVGAVTIGILLLPFIAMQFKSDVDWDARDFIIMGILLFTTGTIFDYAMRSVKDESKKLVVGALIILAFLFIWAELAVGLIGTPFAGS